MIGKQRPIEHVDSALRAKIAHLMGVTPATLTTSWKMISARSDLRGSDARAQLHQRLFPEINVNELM